MRAMMIAALASAGSLAFAVDAVPVQAQTTIPNAVAQVQAGEAATSYAQFRPRRYYSGAPRYYDNRTYGRPGYYVRRDRGNSVAAGIAGLAAGALIGGAIASQQAQAAAPAYVVPDQNAVAYCAQRYRSYDAASGTFLGYDGVRRSCP